MPSPSLFARIAPFLLVWTHVALSYDVPLEKAERPLMAPKQKIPEVTNLVYFDITVTESSEEEEEAQGETKVGRVVLGLFGHVAPKAVENFVALARCNRGNGAIYGKPLCYQGSVLHKIIPNFWIQGGDFTNGDGSGGESIFGQPFEDESFLVKHNHPYLLSMANKGKKNSNGSQFFISTSKTQWLDGKHVAFGMVVEGQDVVKEIEKYGTNGGNPTAELRITACGELPNTTKTR